MSDRKECPSRGITWLLLFAGFCSIVAWVGTNVFLLTNFTNSRHFETFQAALGTVARNLLITSFLVILAALFLPPGLKRLRQTANKGRLVLGAVVPSLILIPLLVIASIAVIMLTPYGLACARSVIFGPDIVQSVTSPDGRYIAYVVDKPSIDGPNHHLYVSVETDTKRRDQKIANLPEDVDFNKEIHFSQRSDMVVFQTHFKLIAASLSDFRTAQVKLGGDHHWRKNGTFWVDYEDVKKPVEITFPDADSFAYRLAGSHEIHTVRLPANTLQ